MSFRYACRNWLLFESATAGCMIDVPLFENNFAQAEIFAVKLNMLVDHFCISFFLMHIFDKISIQHQYQSSHVYISKVQCQILVL